MEATLRQVAKNFIFLTTTIHQEQLVSPLSGLELAQFLEGGADHPVSFSRLYWVDPRFKALIPFLLVLGVPSLTGNFMYQNNFKKKFLNAMLLKNDLYFFFQVHVLKLMSTTAFFTHIK